MVAACRGIGSLPVATADPHATRGEHPGRQNDPSAAHPVHYCLLRDGSPALHLPLGLAVGQKLLHRPLPLGLEHRPKLFRARRDFGDRACVHLAGGLRTVATPARAWPGASALAAGGAPAARPRRLAPKTLGRSLASRKLASPRPDAVSNLLHHGPPCSRARAAPAAHPGGGASRG